MMLCNGIVFVVKESVVKIVFKCQIPGEVFFLTTSFNYLSFLSLFFFLRRRLKRAFKPLYDHTSSYVTVVFWVIQ